MYMHGGDKSLAFSLYTHIHIYIIYAYIYTHVHIAQRLSLGLWETQVAGILSLHTYICVYM